MEIRISIDEALPGDSEYRLLGIIRRMIWTFTDWDGIIALRHRPEQGALAVVLSSKINASSVGAIRVAWCKMLKQDYVVFILGNKIAKYNANGLVN